MADMTGTLSSRDGHRRRATQIVDNRHVVRTVEEPLSAQAALPDELAAVLGAEELDPAEEPELLVPDVDGVVLDEPFVEEAPFEPVPLSDELVDFAESEPEPPAEAVEPASDVLPLLRESLR
jgi:hypothetical protein